MADAVLERDLQEMKELEVRASDGEESAKHRLFYLVSDVARRMTKWQWVIHGDTLEYRQRVVRWLVREGRYTQARRFAMCGRGDVGSVGDVPGSVRIQPKGCGARFCPRCSRRFGRRFLSRVASHLSVAPHGPMWHLVLTQRVIGEESLKDARDRFSRAWKPFYSVLRKAGMKSALATYHVTPSTVKGWHFHCHLLVEWGSEVEEEALYSDLDDAWFAGTREREEHRKALFMRRVCGSGVALDGLAGETQLEFWDEAKDPAEVVLQYMLRDILQGVEKWIGKLQSDDACQEFAAALAGAKLHRLYGVWRTKVVADEADEEDGSDSSAELVKGVKALKEGNVVWETVGTMDCVVFGVLSGDLRSLELVRRLLGRSSNRGAVALRLSRLVTGVAM